MSLKRRLFSLIILDSMIVLFSVYICNYFILPSQNPISPLIVTSSLVLLMGHHLLAARYKLYNRVWRYASMGELFCIFKAVTFSIIIVALIQLIFFQQVTVRTLAITWMMHIILIGGSRFSWRLYRDTYINKHRGEVQKRTLIIGAGAAGTMVARQLLQNSTVDLLPVAFMDDDPTKHRLEMMGLPIVGGVDMLTEIVEQYEIEHIIIAIPSLEKYQLKEIYAQCVETKLKTQIIPMLEDLMLGKISINEIRDVQIEDLLGRDPVELDVDNIGNYVTGKTILVTGAGGSIGSEICRQIASFDPMKVILLGHGENSIYSIEMELKRELGEEIKFFTEIADVQDREKILKVMEQHQPDVVFHAAAHKHVPLMERNPEEAIKNNVLGTKNVAEAASIFGVNTFVMVSTDKAVNPTSVMGASKRLAEMIVQEMDKKSDTRFVAVRFGNVLGSRGSVIPLFKAQIEKGGPVTVTDPEMERYFMTIPEASRLVIQAGALARGGEIFVLDMGEPVKIVDLAKNLIRLSGYTEDEIGIKYTGMRPGEKLFEELLNPDEVHGKQVFPKIYIGKSSDSNLTHVQSLIEEFTAMEIAPLKKRLLDIANNRVEAEQKDRLMVL